MGSSISHHKNCRGGQIGVTWSTYEDGHFGLIPTMQIHFRPSLHVADGLV